VLNWQLYVMIGAMKLAAMRRGRNETGLAGSAGAAKLDRRIPALIPRLAPGDVAVIDHIDLDRVSAESLAEAGVSAVVNAAPSISGRYPCLGAEFLIAAGVPLLDGVGRRVFAVLGEGTHVHLEGDTLRAGETTVATGTRQDAGTVAAAMLAARSGLASQLEAFAAGTAQYLRAGGDLLLDGAGIPPVRTRLAGRPAVVVTRGYDDRPDLAALGRYLREYRPVLIGVNAGADLLLDAGHRPHLVVGELAGISERALTCGAEIVLHTPPDGRVPGLEHALDRNITAALFPAEGAAADLALLLAHAGGAAVVIAVGMHATLEEFLDRGRAGTASAFLARLRVGARLVDAAAVRELYRSRISGAALLLLVLAALVAAAAVLLASAAGQPLAATLTQAWHRLAGWLGGS
jgi:uncharacterized membrane-anchored protein